MKKIVWWFDFSKIQYFDLACPGLRQVSFNQIITDCLMVNRLFSIKKWCVSIPVSWLCFSRDYPFATTQPPMWRILNIQWVWNFQKWDVQGVWNFQIGYPRGLKFSNRISEEFAYEWYLISKESWNLENPILKIKFDISPKLLQSVHYWNK